MLPTTNMTGRRSEVDIFFLLRFHLAMGVASQVEQSVNHETPHLPLQRLPVFLGLVLDSVDRYVYLTEYPFLNVVLQGKREYICSDILLAEFPIQLGHVGVIDKDDPYGSLQPFSLNYPGD